MRLGKLPELIYSRSVDKRIRTHNNKFKGTALGIDCAFLCADGIDLWTEKDTRAIEIALLFRYCFYKAVAVAGKPAMMQAQITLPESCEESELRELISIITECSFKYKLLISGIDVSTQASINRVHINLIYMGSLTETKNLIPQGKKKKMNGRQLVYVGRAGNAGSVLLAKEHFEDLASRYSQDYVRRMADDSCLSAEDDERIVKVVSDRNARVIPVGEGGAFAALWSVGNEFGSGLRVNLKAIPVCQETIELCDYFDINPYMLESSGDCIIICDEAQKLVEELNGMAVEASDIGFLTDNNDRVIINNEEERFLTAPEQDEIFHIEMKHR